MVGATTCRNRAYRLGEAVRTSRRILEFPWDIRLSKTSVEVSVLLLAKRTLVVVV